MLTGKTWGVSIDLTVEKLRGQGPFVCRVSKADGTVEQAAIWGPTPSGRAKVTGAVRYSAEFTAPDMAHG